MNKFLLFLALFAVIALARGDSSEEVIDKVKSRHLKKILKDRRESIDDGVEELEKRCPGVTDKLKTAIKQFSDCDDSVDESLTICEAIQTSAINCTAPLIQVVADCLPPKAKDLPKLGVRSLVSVAGYLCKLQGESIFELANPCLWDDIDDESNEDGECEKNLKTFIAQHKSEIPTAAEICTAATNLRSCAEKNHDLSKCKNQKTKDAARGLVNAILAPCSDL